MAESRIVVLDIETTGKDRTTDQVIEFGFQRGLGPDAEGHVWRIRPKVPIHPEAQAVHGITEMDLRECPSFIDFAPAIVDVIAGADVIVGYGVAFDLDIIQAELARAGLPPLDLQAKQVIDVLRLWHYVEPRTLAAAHEKFCGAPLTNAHAARADVSATGHVLKAMIEAFGLRDKGWPELAAIADPFPGREKWIGPSNHIQWSDAGQPVFMFGKNKGVRVDHVDPGFLRWVIGKEFPPHVKDICSAALERNGDLHSWLTKRYPRAVQP